VAVDAGDDRLRAVRQRLVESVWLDDLALESALLLPVDVAARAERLVAGPGQHDYADLGIRAGRLDGEDHLPERVTGERVVLLRSVDRDVSDVVAHVVEQISIDHRAPPPRYSPASSDVSTGAITGRLRRRAAAATAEWFRPSALAVLRSITNSNFVGCSTGSSAGFCAFQDPVDVRRAVSCRMVAPAPRSATPRAPARAVSSD